MTKGLDKCPHCGQLSVDYDASTNIFRCTNPQCGREVTPQGSAP